MFHFFHCCVYALLFERMWHVHGKAITHINADLYKAYYTLNPKREKFSLNKIYLEMLSSDGYRFIQIFMC